ncbi:hypothetical protein ENSA5_49190 [Enhygromyxa salina]|uniref:DUF2357 domain-containing protein n=1 Tax=Enhygromyxa salina TaxID=215803 RepID=A0A2S9XIA5_9BACT|nr:DUF2357 domain-containing protein [Enhygromyxa salina]PRP92411.1 hypothetical protein ENSA5_49190 [Enhygromyxa salina]
MALSLHARPRPDLELNLVDAREAIEGFRELVEAELASEGEHWRLEIDDEPVAVEHGAGQSRWRWKPSFYAGEVRARLVDLRGGAEHVLRLDVSPNPDKLGRDRFAEIIAELRQAQPEFVLGSEPATTRTGSLGQLDDPLLAYGKLRTYAKDFLSSLERVLAAPVRRLRQERRMLALAQVRRADRRTVFQALRNPQLASLLVGQEQPANSGPAPRLDAPVVEPHVDEAANRCIKALTQSVLRRVVDCRERLAVKVERERESGTRTTLAERWPVRERYLLGLERHLVRALRGPVLSAVTRAQITAGGLNTISAHPVYSRTYKLGWRTLGLGFEGEPRDEDLWLPPTWELYERWCFVTARRLLRESFGFEELATVTSPPADLAWSGSDGAGRRVWLGFQVKCATWSMKKEHEFRSLNVTRFPDLVVSVETGDSARWIVLDAKYRVSRANVLDAMTSAHLYHDALRWRGHPPERALLVVPAAGGAPWLEKDAFHQAHGVGVVVARPRCTNRLEQALAALLG